MSVLNKSEIQPDAIYDVEIIVFCGGFEDSSFSAGKDVLGENLILLIDKLSKLGEVINYSKYVDVTAFEFVPSIQLAKKVTYYIYCTPVYSSKLLNIQAVLKCMQKSQIEANTVVPEGGFLDG
jgi:hypothetical protein